MKQKHKLILALAPLLGVSSQLSAQHVFTDADPGDSNWNTAANWTGGVPDLAGNDIVSVGNGGSSVAVNIVANSGDIFDLRLGDGLGGTPSTGTINHSAGSLTANNWTIIGVDADGAGASTGTYNLSGTASFTSIARFVVGVGGGSGNSFGNVNVSDSASLTGDNLTFGANDGNTGIVNQTGGTVTSNNWVTIGEDNATGSYSISGGSLIATTDMSIGQQNGANGTLNVSGTGSVSADNLRAGRQFGGNPGGATGTISIDGSSASISTGTLELGGESFSAADATGNLIAIADAGGISAITTGAAFLNDGTVTGTSTLSVDLTAWSDFSSIGTGTSAEEIILIDSNDPIVGTFAGLAEGAVISVGGGQTGVLSYVGGSGTDVTVTVLVPEPSTILLSMLGVLGLVARRRR